MLERVAIVGVGYTPLRPISPEVSFRELVFEAAVKAYSHAGVEPRDISTFVSITEDYTEGTAIAEEYVPDQLGAVLKPVHTVTADGITGLAQSRASSPPPEAWRCWAGGDTEGGRWDRDTQWEHSDCHRLMEHVSLMLSGGSAGRHSGYADPTTSLSTRINLERR